MLKQFVDAFRVEPDQHFVVDHHGRRGLTIVLLFELAHGLIVMQNVTLFELCATVFEEELDRFAGQRIRLGKDDDLARTACNVRCD